MICFFFLHPNHHPDPVSSLTTLHYLLLTFEYSTTVKRSGSWMWLFCATHYISADSLNSHRTLSLCNFPLPPSSKDSKKLSNLLKITSLVTGRIMIWSHCPKKEKKLKYCSTGSGLIKGNILSYCAYHNVSLSVFNKNDTLTLTGDKKSRFRKINKHFGY